MTTKVIKIAIENNKKLPTLKHKALFGSFLYGGKPKSFKKILETLQNVF